jgi:hypothetical protein
MNSATRLLAKPLLPLLALTLIYSVGLITLALRGVAPSEGLGLLWRLSFSLFTVYWIRADRVTRGMREPFFEFDAFVFFGYPLVVPYYLFRTRGIAGLAGGLGFWILDFLPFTAARIILTVHGL